jgi:hypothetical protein
MAESTKKTTARPPFKEPAKVAISGRDILLQPIQPNEIEWRVASSKGDNLWVVPYIDARCVQERFDAAFGWQNWDSLLKPLEKGFLCTIQVSVGGVITTKTDAAGFTNIEAIKGAASDSYKRCAVQFGLGRDLYAYPKVAIKSTDKYIPNWAIERLDGLVKHLATGKTLDSPVFIKPKA